MSKPKTKHSYLDAMTVTCKPPEYTSRATSNTWAKRDQNRDPENSTWYQPSTGYSSSHICTNTASFSKQPPHSHTNPIMFCNNCGKKGHLFYQCRMPITSNGVIVFRKTNDSTHPYEYLMIRRRDTLGYLDFLRGKYSLYQKSYLLNMMRQMTIHEKQLLKKRYYSVRNIPNSVSTAINSNTTNAYPYSSHTQPNCKEKIHALIHGVYHENEYYDLLSLIEESELHTPSHELWEEPEWGFPKGRRNASESDYNCAIREFVEETGFSKDCLHDISNMVPVQEVFTGSNYYSYKHKYYIMMMEPSLSLQKIPNFQKSEVSSVAWKNIDACLAAIRPYNLEKRDMITRIDNCLKTTSIVQIDGGF